MYHIFSRRVAWPDGQAGGSAYHCKALEGCSLRAFNQTVNCKSLYNRRNCIFRHGTESVETAAAVVLHDDQSRCRQRYSKLLVYIHLFKSQRSSLLSSFSPCNSSYCMLQTNPAYSYFFRPCRLVYTGRHFPAQNTCWTHPATRIHHSP